jgi:hypothetical protein
LQPREFVTRNDNRNLRLPTRPHNSISKPWESPPQKASFGTSHLIFKENVLLPKVARKSNNRYEMALTA